jgi:hypothetical protein
MMDFAKKFDGMQINEKSQDETSELYYEKDLGVNIT